MNDTAMYDAMIKMLNGTSAEVALLIAIGAAARSHNLNLSLYYRQIWAESHFNPLAVNPQSGCLGLGQMNPKYWPDATVDIENNLELSAGYMERLLKHYDGSYPKALAAYNYGPTNVDELISEYGDDWFGHLPFETQEYVDWIMSIDKEYEEHCDQEYYQ